MVETTAAAAGAITTATAATAIANAAAAYAIGTRQIFVVSNNTDGAAFLFTSAAADNTVTAGELTKISDLTGANTADITAYVAGNFLLA